MTAPAATILIVDDEPQNRRLLEALLRPEGYETRSVASGEDALASIAEAAPDLVLLDMMMPGMDGCAVARVLKADPVTAAIPVIMVTAQIDRAARIAGLDAGAEDFLTKPVDRVELWLRVRNLLRAKALGDLLLNHNAILEEEVRARTVDLQRFRTAMDVSADGIFLIDRATMRFIEVNTTATVMTGYTRNELLRSGPAEIGMNSRRDLARAYDAVIAGSGTADWAVDEVTRRDGTSLPVEVHRHALGPSDPGIVVAVVRDITERTEVEKRMHHLAHYDALTGLPNRTLFYDTLKKTLTQAQAQAWSVAVLFVDIDHFKKVNDTLGHANGDALLQHVAARLVECVRIRDTVGRLSGDEFALIIVLQDGQHGAAVVANKIKAALAAPFELHGHDVAVTVSVGVTLYPDDSSDAEALIKFADTAMYRAKQAGRDTFRFFTAQMNLEMMARLDLEEALRTAVAEREFVLHYQPKVQLASGRIVGVEALLRWQRPGHGLVSPMEFIPVLEETGLIVEVGGWVIGEACRQAGAWLRSPIGPMQVSVNLSSRQVFEGDLVGDIVKALAAADIPPDLLELELTEGSLMANTERTIDTLRRVKAVGVQISIDDFGTGYSSLAYLRRFPIDKLKIDIAFIREITSSADDAAIVVTIIRMAHGLKLDVIAEGVETPAQLACLRRYGCDEIQGWHFSPAVPVDEVEQMLRDRRGLAVPHGASGVGVKTLLLVDDEPDVLAVLEELLGQDGYRILLASSAQEAFELLAVHQVQVVVSDQRMGGMTGTDFLDRVKELRPDALRIILSGYTDLNSILEAINLGAAHRVYTKPWDGQALRENIKEAFRYYWRLHELALEDLVLEG